MTITRDTDRDWAKLGEDEPFFGVLANPRYLRRNLTDEALEEFWQSGVNDMAHIVRTVRHHLGTFAPFSAIDFGCGVGRLTRAMAGHCEQVTGVDVSPGMRQIAEDYAADNMRVSDAIPVAPVDWVNSSIVFQHIPPRHGYVLFDTLLDQVKPGGVFSIHITIFKDTGYLQHMYDSFKFASWDGVELRHVTYDADPEGSMQMYDYDLSRIMMSAVTRGFGHFFMEHANHGGCHGLMIYGRRQGI